MPNLSFALTTEQFLDGSKTVTRRLGWNKGNCRPGMRMMGVEKGQGLGKGGKVKRLGEIVVVSVRREPLLMIDQLDVIREGFPDMDPVDFITMFCEHHGGVMMQEVTRIEFDHVDLHQDRTPCMRCKGRHKMETVFDEETFHCPNCKAIWAPNNADFVVANPELKS